MIEVSFIIPVYNAGKYIEQCLESILKLEIRNSEIIIINDGSTDNSNEICEKFSKSHERIIYLEQSNQGQSSARNRGINCAKGEYIFFVDADDLVNKFDWEKLYITLKQNHIDILGFAAFEITEDGKKILGKVTAFGDKVKNEEIFSGIEIVEKYGYRKVEPMVWMYVYRREFIKHTSLWFHQGCYHEDCEFCLKAICNSKRVMYIAQVFYIHRMSKNSTIRSMNIKKAYDLIEIAKEIARFINSLDVSESAKKELNRYVAYLLITAIETCELQGGNIRSFLSENIGIELLLEGDARYIPLKYCIKNRLYCGVTAILQIKRLLGRRRLTRKF